MEDKFVTAVHLSENEEHQTLGIRLVGVSVDDIERGGGRRRGPVGRARAADPSPPSGARRPTAHRSPNSGAGLMNTHADRQPLARSGLAAASRRPARIRYTAFCHPVISRRRLNSVG